MCFTYFKGSNFLDVLLHLSGHHVLFFQDGCVGSGYGSAGEPHVDELWFAGSRHARADRPLHLEEATTAGPLLLHQRLVVGVGVSASGHGFGIQRCDQSVEMKAFVFQSNFQK